jgi:DeoR family transcriptional regulator of aga operon
MLNAERRNEIQKLISQKKRLLVKELCQMFDTSTVTIRKDLATLEERGVLTRVHGGAILNETLIADLSVTEKERIFIKEKERIARKAESLIRDGDAIILDSGSTTTFIARRIKFRKNLRIITNAVNIATELAASENEIILTGGVLRPNSFSLVGPLADETMRHVTVDKFFLGVDGIDLVYGLTTPNLLEARLGQLMIRAAEQVIVVTDSSKFNKRTMGVIGDLAMVDIVITDKGCPEAVLRELRNCGVKTYAV